METHRRRLNLRRLLVLTLLIGLGGAAVLLLRHGENTNVSNAAASAEPTRADDVLAEDRIKIKNKLIDVPVSGAASASAQSATALSKERVRSFAFHGSGPETSVNAVLENPDPLLEKARQGDAPAAIAVISAVNVCFPLRQEIGDLPVDRTVKIPHFRSNFSECNNMDSSLANERLSLLIPAINSGSAEAKLMYALLAKRVFYNDPYAGDMQASHTDDQLNRLIERYAQDAAKAGIEEGYSFLAKSYARGDFGLRDPVSAYTYAVALSRVGKSGLGSYLAKEYGKGLTDRQAADAIARANTLIGDRP
jgi:hypothetical protein